MIDFGSAENAHDMPASAVGAHRFSTLHAFIHALTHPVHTTSLPPHHPVRACCPWICSSMSKLKGPGAAGVHWFLCCTLLACHHTIQCAPAAPGSFVSAPTSFQHTIQCTRVAPGSFVCAPTSFQRTIQCAFATSRPFVCPPTPSRAHMLPPDHLFAYLAFSTPSSALAAPGSAAQC